MALLLRKRQADQLKRMTRLPERERPRDPAAARGAAPAGSPLHARAVAPPGSPPSSRQTLAALRKDLNGLIAAWHHRTGQPHGAVHAELRRAAAARGHRGAAAGPHRDAAPLGVLSTMSR